MIIQRAGRREEIRQAGEDALHEHVFHAAVALRDELRAKLLYALVGQQADLKLAVVVFGDKAFAAVHYIPVFAAGQHAHAVDLFKAVEDVEPVLTPAEIAEADAIAADERRAVELAPDLIEEVRLVQTRQRLGHSGAVDELLRLAVIALRAVHAHDSVAEYDHIRAIRAA